MNSLDFNYCHMASTARLKHPIPLTQWPTEAEAAHGRLFAPLSARRLQLATRTWVPAMVPWRATEHGDVTDAVLGWYERFARGRPGALVVEATGVRDMPSGPLLRIGHDRFLPGLSRLVDVVRRASAGETRLFIQIIDFLAIRRRPSATSIFGQLPRASLTGIGARLDGLARLRRGHPRGAAALRGRCTKRVFSRRARYEALGFGYRERVTDLDLPHIRELPRVLPRIFADAAGPRRASRLRRRRAALRTRLHDGVVPVRAEHARRMATADPASNRVRLPLEVFAAVRARVGAGFVVGCRFLGDE